MHTKCPDRYRTGIKNGDWATNENRHVFALLLLLGAFQGFGLGVMVEKIIDALKVNLDVSLAIATGWST